MNLPRSQFNQFKNYILTFPHIFQTPSLIWTHTDVILHTHTQTQTSHSGNQQDRPDDMRTAVLIDLEPWIIYLPGVVTNKLTPYEHHTFNRETPFGFSASSHQMTPERRWRSKL
ncbi:hypothetical protein OCU04_005915 [Sclerotinia nivalis]|uniref:Uncharacterized protein n=1 Tax=Sclerotinia nivalis TaxID=352851 RepID=A0A9X0AM45_9HELO|nr:hypothetical protein OCU04_005915 [Sclerotinia nivalis]